MGRMVRENHQRYSKAHLQKTQAKFLVLSIALCISNICMLQQADAQNTTASLHGSVTPGGNQVIEIESDKGDLRTVAVDEKGQYEAHALPLGTYKIRLKKDGEVVEEKDQVVLKVNSDQAIVFSDSAPADANLGEVDVGETAAPAIDVTQTQSHTVLTAKDLQRLPLHRSAEGIAILAPGAVRGSHAFDSGPYSGAISFGGAGVTENAYYINGYLTSNPLTNIGGISLPYAAVNQQETYTGGYSARYGRSAGGVISQIGKNGTNKFSFGGQVLWSPKAFNKSAPNGYFTDAPAPPGYTYTLPNSLGKLNQYTKKNTAWNTVESVYAGGPLVKDHLFGFLALENNRTGTAQTSASNASTVGRSYLLTKEPKVYAKLDWNVNDNNLLEFTGISDIYRQSGHNHDFNYATLRETGPSASRPNSIKVDNSYYIFKYSGNVTETIYASALLGKSRQDTVDKNFSNQPYIANNSFQDPALTGGSPIHNSQGSDHAVDGKSRTHGMRLELTWRVAKQNLTAGIDNVFFAANNEGYMPTGPGYAWIYNKQKPDAPINSALGVGAPMGEGYFVSKKIYHTASNMSVAQKAYFIEDRWNVTDTFLVALGLRDDTFRNRNNRGEVFARSGNQVAPRFGWSWDVLGDASLKLFGNAGRYYLALPNSVALRGATPSINTNEYFTYTGIDAEGNPTGLTPLGPGPVSGNAEYGVTPDPRSVSARNLKSMYQDEFILGFNQLVADKKLLIGAKVSYRNLGTAIDDVCDPSRMAAKLQSMGIDPTTVNYPGCVLFNPGKSNNFDLANKDGSGYTTVHMTKKDWGFVKGAKRKYIALDMFVQYPSDGTWEGRVDYTLSHNFGNTEGQVDSGISQADVSRNLNWDAASLMLYSGGILPNDRRHQLKFYGSYQINPQWQASATFIVNSGAPKSCYGYYGIDDAGKPAPSRDPANDGSSYHVCNHAPSRPGAVGRTPWTEMLNLGVTYFPSFAHHKLAFDFQIFNVFNQLRPVQVNSQYEDNADLLSNSYGGTAAYTAPQSARITMRYDY